MKNKVIFIIVPIFSIIVGLVLNFQESLMGSPATVKNLIVTFVYFTIWIFILIITLKSKNRRVMKYYSTFWLLTLLFTILTGFVNVTGVNVDWATPFVALLLTQFYGIELLVDNFIITSIIISSLSLMMFIAAVFSLKKPNLV
ncbi:hypothetical protein [Lysinibacillus telephonicus]|uniref:Uncharacterized protein n=1 Tax=Lysinibacillus telephonicus TaxID=1714840 RepID=A0A431UEA4_9BACI|nr:hypothetical protein [Lysinibacillus telephonicus]RTQ87436.1 hypothetical protein EKG35_19115 [Lysinibacillus telephonicus]